MAKKVLRSAQRLEKKRNGVRIQSDFIPPLRDTLDRGRYQALRRFHPRTLDARPGTESKASGAAYNFLLTSKALDSLHG